MLHYGWQCNNRSIAHPFRSLRHIFRRHPSYDRCLLWTIFHSNKKKWIYIIQKRMDNRLITCTKPESNVKCVFIIIYSRINEVAKSTSVYPRFAWWSAGRDGANILVSLQDFIVVLRNVILEILKIFRSLIAQFYTPLMSANVKSSFFY